MPQNQCGCQQQYKQYQPQQQRFNPMQYRQTYGLQPAQQRYGGFNRVTPQWQFIQPTFRGRSFSFSVELPNPRKQSSGAAMLVASLDFWRSHR